ncbi:hypothetical protein [Campylobacter ureolyticus]|uniref:Uncharacterized protein n=1 Tax=Campylobacter ureolyticus TaxID=827 RepID=A0A9Q4KJE1_9BACT|nr:hypothetical protein [Campylobacter ureolyticus]MCZ6159222.1 hypothetical protein [Campylobacter ureolyticus]
MGLFNAIFGNKKADELEKKINEKNAIIDDFKKELYEKNNQLACLSKIINEKNNEIKDINNRYNNQVSSLIDEIKDIKNQHNNQVSSLIDENKILQNKLEIILKTNHLSMYKFYDKFMDCLKIVTNNYQNINISVLNFQDINIDSNNDNLIYKTINNIFPNIHTIKIIDLNLKEFPNNLHYFENTEIIYLIDETKTINEDKQSFQKKILSFKKLRKIITNIIPYTEISEIVKYESKTTNKNNVDSYFLQEKYKEPYRGIYHMKK